MSIEARNLAKRMNNLDLSKETSKDKKDWETGKIEYDNIKRNIEFILPSGLEQVVNYLNENGKIVYERFYKKLIEEEIKEWTTKRR